MFWERFYNLCISKNTKPNPVAKEIGVSSGTLTKWKTQNVLPNGETLKKIADYLNCSVDYLLGRTDYPEINNGQFIGDSFGAGKILNTPDGYAYIKHDAIITPELEEMINEVIKQYKDSE